MQDRVHDDTNGAPNNLEGAPASSEVAVGQLVEEQPESGASSEGLDEGELRQILESLLFVSHVPLTVDRLTTLLEAPSKKEVERILRLLQHEYDRDQRGWQLVELAGGFQLVTHGACAPWIKKLTKVKTAPKLSRSALETLAIIAYNQPIIRSQIEDIRGVETSGVLRTLLDQRLIRIAGRKDIPGRPLMYGTTKLFLQRFGLRDLSSLPPLRDIKELGESETLPLPLDHSPSSDNGDTLDSDAASDQHEDDTASMPSESTSS